MFKNKNEKIEQIHQAIYENRRWIQEVYWGQKFSFAIRGSKWLVKANFNVGHWALGFPALYILFRVLNAIKPKSIIEFGLGESTRMTFQYVQSFPDVKLQVIEQNQDWFDFFVVEVPGITKNVKMLPVEKRNVYSYETSVYSNLIENISGQKYDLVLIDGPVGSPNFSRSQLIDIIEYDLLDDNFVILLDDYDRTGEQQTAAKCLDLLHKKGVVYNCGSYRGEKTMLAICSERYKYLTDL